MTQHAPTKTQVMPAAEYFKAKLAYEMSPYGLHEILDRKSDDYQIVDVRSPSEFALGHVPTAINIPLADLPAKLSSLPKNKTIVTSCGSITCQLAPRAALELAQKGFKVMELHGGFREWTSYGFPVEKS